MRPPDQNFAVRLVGAEPGQGCLGRGLMPAVRRGSARRHPPHRLRQPRQSVDLARCSAMLGSDLGAPLRQHRPCVFLGQHPAGPLTGDADLSGSVRDGLPATTASTSCSRLGSAPPRPLGDPALPQPRTGPGSTGPRTEPRLRTPARHSMDRGGIGTRCLETHTQSVRIQG